MADLSLQFEELEDAEDIALKNEESAVQPQLTQEQIAAQPAKPVSAYILFIKDLKARGAEQELGKNFLQEASKQWGALTQEEKDRFNAEARTMKEAWQ